MSSFDACADEVWFDRYTRHHDKASTYSPGIQRNMAQVLPMGFGMHFPSASDSAHASHNESIEVVQFKTVEAGSGGLEGVLGLAGLGHHTIRARSHLSREAISTT
ncbi:unnamed protein product [Prorocentrum cordatum]|uniref:Uncharacterized protein n=1 Tax=Prorocentrum cordatum TaxID=2364126 RepID=A0ABN9PC19_9DINO|nr:unnamed protein product [Polarella glacialis]